MEITWIRNKQNILQLWMSSSYNNVWGLPELIEVVFDEIYIKGTNLFLGNIYIKFVRALELLKK